MFTLKFIVAVVLGLVSVASSDTCEENGYTFTPEIGCHKFYFLDYKVSWDEAQKACEAEDADLVIINSEDEAKHLAQTMISHNPNTTHLTWVGIHEQAGKWVSIKGDTLENTGYSKWLSTYRPHKPLAGFCLSFYTTNQTDGLYDYLDCVISIVKEYVCEK